MQAKIEVAAIVQAICLVVVAVLLAISLVVPVKTPERQWDYLIQSVPDHRLAGRPASVTVVGESCLFPCQRRR